MPHQNIEEVAKRRNANLAKARAARAAKHGTNMREKPTVVPKNIAEAQFLAGITRTECPIECGGEKCAITHTNICGHPMKGGLQAVFKARPDCVERYNKARKKLLKDDLERNG